MTSSAHRYLAGSWRAVCSALTLDPTGEKFAFARFRGDKGEEAVPSAEVAATPESAHHRPQQLHRNGTGTDPELANFRTLSNPCDGDGDDGPVDGSCPAATLGSGKAKDHHGESRWMMSEGGMESSGKPGIDGRNRISAWQAGWNVTNAIQGMFIVSFPFTVLKGGYWALLSMIIVAYVCCYTGKILVDCLYEDEVDPGTTLALSTAAESGGVKSRVTSPCREDGDAPPGTFRPGQRRVRDSYVAIAEAVWGRQIGGRLVLIAQLIELLMTCILYVLLCGELLQGVFPDWPLDLTTWIIVSGVTLLPCAFLRNLRHVAWLSFWCTAAHLIINGIVIVYCFTWVLEWHWKAVQFRIDIWEFLMSLGIVIFSYTSQIFLPSLEANLIDRRQFAPMLHWTHVAAAVFKVAFSYVGFVTFGNDTKEVITNNLPNQTMKVIVNLFFIAKALLSYPLPYFAAADLLETAFFRGRPTTLFPSCYEKPASKSSAPDVTKAIDSEPPTGEASPETGPLKLWALFLRLCLVVSTVLMAIYVPHFAILMSLIGSFTGNMLSLVWPAYFHLRIKSASIGWVRRSADITIVLFGLICSGLGIYSSSNALVYAFIHGNSTRPLQPH